MGRYGEYDPHTVEYQIYRGEATDSCPCAATSTDPYFDYGTVYVTGPRIDEDCVVSICSTSQSTSILGAYDILRDWYTLKAKVSHCFISN